MDAEPYRGPEEEILAGNHLLQPLPHATFDLQPPPGLARAIG